MIPKSYTKFHTGDLRDGPIEVAGLNKIELRRKLGQQKYERIRATPLLVYEAVSV